MNLQEQISRMKSMMGVINENTSHIFTNTNVMVGDVYEESEIYTYVQKLHYKRKEDFWEGDLGDRIEEYPYYVVREIPIDEIDMDVYQIDEDDLEEYIELFKELQSYPPIVLTKEYDIIDGTHRANALRELGLTSIICFVGKIKI